MYDLPIPDDDGLPKPKVGDWSQGKHHFLWGYLNAFTTAMRKKEWTGLHYIDLFGGAGMEQLRDSGKLAWGSPLLAAQAKYKFGRLHVCEKSKRKIELLKTRLHRFPQPEEPQLLHGDANRIVGEITRQIPEGSLSLAFLDPFGLHLNFATLRQLSERRTDLIIFFPDRLDALRNWRIYDAKPNSNLDRFLGETSWLSALKAAPQENWCEVLKALYLDRIRTLGYKFFDTERIYAHGRPLYLLIFASMHQMGLSIWSRVSTKKPDDQRSFDFGN